MKDRVESKLQTRNIDVTRADRGFIVLSEDDIKIF